MPQASVLFVCLGNICRSPMAEGAFRSEAEKAGLDIACDSAGTSGWHAGEPPDDRAQAAALRHGVDIASHRAREVSPEDFRRFTHIVALDRQNLADLKRMRPRDCRVEIKLLLDHVPGREGRSVADPYYGDAADFDRAWRDASAGASALVRLLREK